MTKRERPGRPLKFESAEDLEVRINQYFEDCDKQEDNRVFRHDEIVTEGKKGRVCSVCGRPEKAKGCQWVSGELKKRRPYTVSGLAVWLDTSRQTLLNYEIKPEFFDTIMRARQRIEQYAEEKLYDPDAPTNGVKFSLSNNADGWTDKKSTDFTVQKDSAATLAKALFDEEDEEEDTSLDAKDRSNPVGTGKEDPLAPHKA